MDTVGLNKFDEYGLYAYDPFDINAAKDLDNFIKLLTDLTFTLDIVKVVLEQKGYTATGLKVNVNVAAKAVRLRM
jgi:hypothetical protein